MVAEGLESRVREAIPAAVDDSAPAPTATNQLNKRVVIGLTIESECILYPPSFFSVSRILYRRTPKYAKKCIDCLTKCKFNLT